MPEVRITVTDKNGIVIDMVKVVDDSFDNINDLAASIVDTIESNYNTVEE